MKITILIGKGNVDRCICCFSVTVQFRGCRIKESVYKIVQHLASMDTIFCIISAYCDSPVRKHNDCDPSSHRETILHGLMRSIVFLYFCIFLSQSGTFALKTKTIFSDIFRRKTAGNKHCFILFLLNLCKRVCHSVIQRFLVVILI